MQISQLPVSAQRLCALPGCMHMVLCGVQACQSCWSLWLFGHRWKAEQKDLLDEMLPKATGREAAVEKRLARRCGDRGSTLGLRALEPCCASLLSQHVRWMQRGRAMCSWAAGQAWSMRGGAAAVLRARLVLAGRRPRPGSPARTM